MQAHLCGSAINFCYSQSVSQAEGRNFHTEPQDVLRMVEGLTADVAAGSMGTPESMESPIAGLVRAVTPLMLEDLQQPETQGATPQYV